MIDIVIPLGSGSIWQNNELRYALRSIEIHVKNFRNIFIIGDLPEWAQNIIHIPYTETGHASQNIMEKIKLAAQHQDITTEFLFSNDDIFFTSPIEAQLYPYFHRGPLNNAVLKNQNNWYQQYVIETINTLQERAHATFNFDTHCPIRYNKHLFIDTMDKYDFEQKLTVKSIYCNTLNIQGEYMDDCKICGYRSKAAIESLITGRHVFSIGDQCLGDSPIRDSPMKTILKSMFPNPSKYEKP